MTELRMDYGKVAPKALTAMLATNRYLDGSTLPQGLRRLVELRVSQINKCSYCIWLHAQQARDLGESDESVDSVADWFNTVNLLSVLNVNSIDSPVP